MKRYCLILCLTWFSIGTCTWCQQFAAQTSACALDVNSDPDDWSRFGVSIKLGRKFPVHSTSPSFSPAMFYGFGLKLNFGRYVSVQPELSFWNSSQSISGVTRNTKARETAVIISGQNFMRPYDVRLYAGIGGFKYTYQTLRETTNDGAGFLYIGAGYGFELSKDIDLVVYVRSQAGGRLSLGGGTSFKFFTAGVNLEWNL